MEQLRMYGMNWRVREALRHLIVAGSVAERYFRSVTVVKLAQLEIAWWLQEEKQHSA
jgi:hypothetical protein